MINSNYKQFDNVILCCTVRLRYIVVSGYLANVWKLDDLIVLVHCPETPKLPTLSFKSMPPYAVIFLIHTSCYSYFYPLNCFRIRRPAEPVGPAAGPKVVW